MPITYTFTDNSNSHKGITQYRIKQVDLDNKAKLSEIRAVRGYGQNGNTIVYPNPSSDGRITVVFEDMDGTRDISLSDMFGRVVAQWQGVSENNLQISNLREGMYSLRIMIRESGAVSTEKIVVTTR